MSFIIGLIGIAIMFVGFPWLGGVVAVIALIHLYISTQNDRHDWLDNWRKQRNTAPRKEAIDHIVSESLVTEKSTSGHSSATGDSV